MIIGIHKFLIRCFNKMFIMIILVHIHVPYSAVSHDCKAVNNLKVSKKIIGLTMSLSTLGSAHARFRC